MNPNADISPAWSLQRPCLPLTLTLLLFLTATLAQAQPAPSATLTISSPPIQPATLPIVLTLTVQNTGPVPISYWCSGLGTYPDAADYRVCIQRISPDTQSFAPLHPFNGQGAVATGQAPSLRPGDSVNLPAAFGTLTPGKYRVCVTCEPDGHSENNQLQTTTWPALRSQPIELEVRDDPALVATRDTQLLQDVRSGNPFAVAIAFAAPRPLIREALTHDLMSADPITVERAMDGLWTDQRPPDEDADLILKTITSHLQPPPDSEDFAMMRRLLAYSTYIISPTSLKAQIKVAAARPTGRLHLIATDAMTHMRNRVMALPPASTQPSSTQPASTQSAPAPYDPDAIRALIQLTSSPRPRDRLLAYLLLSRYPKDSSAINSIRTGTADPDPEVRTAAQMSFNIVSP